MSDDLRENVTDTNIWLRLLFMLLFAVIFGATRLVLVTVIAIQFLWVLFSGSKNSPLLSFGSQLSTFIYQIYRYLSFNTEKRPFPFDEWPSDRALLDDAAAEQEAAPGTVTTETVETVEDAAQFAGRQEPEILQPDSVMDVASESGIESGSDSNKY